MLHPYVGIVKKLRSHFPEYMDISKHTSDKPIGIICAMRFEDDNDVVASSIDGVFLQFKPFEDWSLKSNCEGFISIERNNIFIKYDVNSFKKSDYIVIEKLLLDDRVLFETDSVDDAWEFLKPYLFD